VRFDPGLELELEANPYYWRQGYPRSASLVFAFGVAPQDILAEFRAGRFTLASWLLAPDVEALRRDPEYAAGYRHMAQLSTFFVVFNARRGPLSDEGLRHHLVRSVHVEGLVRRTHGASAVLAQGLIPPGLLGHEPTQGPTRWVSDSHAPAGRVELAGLMLPVYEKGTASALRRELFDAFAAAGCDVEVMPRTTVEWDNALSAGAADVFLGGWNADYPDADAFLHGVLHSQRGVCGRFCGSPEVDRLIERGRTETDPDLRHEVYAEIEEIVARRAFVLPLFHRTTSYFARPEVEGFELNFLPPYVSYEKLRLRR
jgi:peptide/nickel transport system substrate-binding protein